MTLAGRRVLVTGATGAIGAAVVSACQAAGASVRTLQRHPFAHPGVDSLIGDVTRPASLAPALAGVDAVVHLASLLHVINPPPTLRAEYERVNDQGTALVVRACEAAGVARLVYASTIAVYGATRPGDAPITEDARPAPATDYAMTKLAGEAHVVAARTAAGAPMGVVLRLAAVYGAGVKGNYRRLLRGLARGLYLGTGDGRNRRTLVHEADVAAAVVLALSHPEAPGRVFNVTDGAVYEVREIVAAMAGALGRPAPRFAVPTPVARAAAGLVEAASTVLGRRAPISRDTIDKLLEDMAVDGSRFGQVVGFTPRYGLVDGWRRVVDEWRAQGVLPPAGRPS